MSGARPIAATSDQAVRAACEAEWPAHNSDCSAFVRAVAVRLDVPVVGTADAITNRIRAGHPWTVLRDGPAAAAAAQRGCFVLAGLRGDEQAVPNANGHVVVVVSGVLNRGLYPHAYWGQLHGVGKRDQTINWAWSAADRDGVTYAFFEP